MKILKPLVATACAVLCATTLSACNSGKSTLLGEPENFSPVTYQEIQADGFTAFKSKAEKFAADFAPAAYADVKNGDNFAVSPVSVYMALSLAAECADGETREEILSALGVTYAQLKENYPVFYRSLSVENKYDGKVTGILSPSNSIWVNEGTSVNKPCIDALSEYYYAYSYSADFKNDNVEANKAVRNFIKDKTRGLIDKDFKLSKETLFTLINTLYLKTIWNDSGDDIAFTDRGYDFENSDGSVKNTKLLSGYYNTGRVCVSEKYSSFFTRTYDGYKIKFIVPNDGYTVNDVFTSEIIFDVNSRKDYNAVDEENKIMYETRCLFPEFKAKFDEDVTGILKNKFGIDKFFKDPGIHSAEQSCDFSNLTEEKCYCKKVQHVTDLTVDRKGIEGAAVTVIAMDGATAESPEYERVYEEFIVDRAFGFIITDYQDVTLFSGVVEKV